MLTDRGLRFRNVRKLNDTHSFGTSALEKDLGEFYLTRGFEEFNEIFIGG